MQGKSSRADIEDVAAGTLHQGILRLFRDDPWLAFDLLRIPRPTDGTPIDRHAEVDIEGADAFHVRQGFPDLVLVAKGGRGGGAVITVEAQKKPDKRKRWRIPLYQILLAVEHQLPTWAVVVSFSKRMSKLVEEWSQGHPPKVDALVLDIDNVPVDAGREPGQERPTAAVLAAALHGYAGDLRAARNGLRVAMSLPQPQRRRYANTILAALPKPERERLMRQLPVEEEDELMEIERQSGTYFVGHDEGLRKGLEKGRRLALGELTLAQLASRGVPVDRRSEARIRKSKSMALLQRWALRAASVNSVAELFARA